MRTAIGIACFMLLAPSAIRAQQTIVLKAPDAEYAEPFSVVSGVRPLSDGRLIVSDSREKTLQLIDFRSAARKISSEGRGPNEWMLPNGLAALRGDTTALWDAGNRRFLRITPDGAPAGDFRVESNLGPMSTPMPRGVDSRGNIYIQGSPFTYRGANPAVADSVAILRFDRASERIDTVAFVHPAAGAATVGASANGGVSISNGLANPLVPLDDWGTLPDGRIAVVRGADYHIDFYENRAVKAFGPPAVFERRPVDGAIKAAVTEQRRRELSGVASRSGRDGSVSALPPDFIMQKLMNLEPWPATTPAFMRNAVIVRALGTSGQIWVFRTMLRDTDPSRYDVFNDAGRVIARVELPPRTRIVAFGGSFAYAIRTDDDDLQYLQRYRLPPI